MNCPRLLDWIPVMSLAALSAASVNAAESASAREPVSANREAHALKPAQITAIRIISRNVLAAKRSGAEESTDAAHLASLRVSLDQLIAADLDPQNRTPITVQGQESDEQRKTSEKVARLREAARSDALAVVEQLNHRGELKAAHARATPEEDTRSAGLPVGEQRAQLFERLAHKLSAALADGNENRTTDLLELREQLGSTKRGVTNALLTHATPTLLAMPAGYVPPHNSVGNNSAPEK